MPIEIVTNGIEDLNESWPLGSDLLDTADDHTRLTKKALKLTFQDLGSSGGSTLASADELNALVGVTGNIQNQIDAKIGRVPWTFPPANSTSGIRELWDLQANTRIMPTLSEGYSQIFCTLPFESASAVGDFIFIRPNMPGVGISGAICIQAADTSTDERFWVKRADGTWQNATIVCRDALPPWPAVLCTFGTPWTAWTVRAINTDFLFFD